MDEVNEAREMVLRQFNARAPFFHRHMVRRKLLGGIWHAGDRVIVFEIIATLPEGPVQVTKQTVIRFE